jgi:hypothetical protein
MTTNVDAALAERRAFFDKPHIRLLQSAVADVFGNEDRIITKPLNAEGRAAVKARVPEATDTEIDRVYCFRNKYEMNAFDATGTWKDFDA